MILFVCLSAAAQPIPIGYYGPAEGTLWQGAQLAVEEANRESDSFRLIQGWDDNPWSGGAAIVVRMAYEDRVVAIIGSVNGDSTHLAEQVVAKALLPLVDPASTDRTVNAAFVPWMYSVMPDDRTLMQALVAELPPGPFVLLTGTNHDARLTTKEFISLLGTRRPLRHIEFEDPGTVIPQLEDLQISSAVILADAGDSARLVRDLRSTRPGLGIFGSHLMGRLTFLEQADEAASGVTYASPGPVSSDFEERFRIRYHHPPDYAAAHAYDAANLVIAAIRTAGSDREAVRDALQQLSPYNGVSGPIEWDALRRNNRKATVKRVSGPSTPATPVAVHGPQE